MLFRRPLPTTRNTPLIRICHRWGDCIAALSHSPHTLNQCLGSSLLSQYLCQLLWTYNQLHFPNTTAIIPWQNLSVSSLQQFLIINRHPIRRNYRWWRWRVASVLVVLFCEFLVERQEIVQFACVEFFIVQKGLREEITCSINSVAWELVGYAFSGDGCVELHYAPIWCHNLYHFLYLPKSFEHAISHFKNSLVGAVGSFFSDGEMTKRGRLVWIFMPWNLANLRWQV